MNETHFAPETGELTLNWFNIFSKSALYQRGPRLYPQPLANLLHLMQTGVLGVAVGKGLVRS